MRPTRGSPPSQARAFCGIEDGELLGVAEIDRKMLLASRQKHDSLDEIVDVAKAARLAAVAVDGERLAAQGLHDEIGDDAPVAGMQARAIGVEDARDARIDGARTSGGPQHG